MSLMVYIIGSCSLFLREKALHKADVVKWLGDFFSPSFYYSLQVYPKEGVKRKGEHLFCLYAFTSTDHQCFAVKR